MADDFYISRGLSSYDMAVAAEQYRAQFGIAQVDYADIIEILEFKIPQFIPGFHVVVVKDEDLDAHARSVFDPPCLVVRQSIYEAANNGSASERFILAHELGHILLHATHVNKMPAKAHKSVRYDENIKNLGGLESAEAQADSFALFFLIPPRQLAKRNEDVGRLQLTFGVSLSVVKRAIALSKRREFYQSSKPRRKIEAPEIAFEKTNMPSDVGGSPS